MTSTGEYCLNGITRGLVIELARRLDLPVVERPFSLTDVYSADESFVTGTFGALTPVVAVDGRTIGDGAPGPITASLSAAHRAAVHEEANR